MPPRGRRWICLGIGILQRLSAKSVVCLTASDTACPRCRSPSALLPSTKEAALPTCLSVALPWSSRSSVATVLATRSGDDRLLPRCSTFSSIDMVFVQPEGRPGKADRFECRVLQTSRPGETAAQGLQRRLATQNSRLDGPIRDCVAQGGLGRVLEKDV